MLFLGDAPPAGSEEVEPHVTRIEGEPLAHSGQLAHAVVVDGAGGHGPQSLGGEGEPVRGGERPVDVVLQGGPEESAGGDGDDTVIWPAGGVGSDEADGM